MATYKCRKILLFFDSTFFERRFWFKLSPEFTISGKQKVFGNLFLGRILYVVKEQMNERWEKSELECEKKDERFWQ